MSRLYVILDVFCDRVLAGNPLAVVLDAANLDDGAMQAIAREFNLSETVFLLPAEDDDAKARLRIFTPVTELPFAGHPTVGTAVLLGLMDAAAGKGRETAFTLEEAVGTVRCRARATGRRSGHARFEFPRPPSEVGPRPDPVAVAEALGLDEEEIGFGSHAPTRFDAGNPFCFVPVRTLAALGRPGAGSVRWTDALGDVRGVYLYTSETGDPALAYRARMLSPTIGEDPATGSAAAAFAGVVARFDAPADGETTIRIGQGYEMGRPSVIELGLTVEAGSLLSGAIGGNAVVAAEGTLFTS